MCIFLGCALLTYSRSYQKCGITGSACILECSAINLAVCLPSVGTHITVHWFRGINMHQMCRYMTATSKVLFPHPHFRPAVISTQYGGGRASAWKPIYLSLGRRSGRCSECSPLCSSTSVRSDGELARNNYYHSPSRFSYYLTSVKYGQNGNGQ